VVGDVAVPNRKGVNSTCEYQRGREWRVEGGIAGAGYYRGANLASFGWCGVEGESLRLGMAASVGIWVEETRISTYVFGSVVGIGISSSLFRVCRSTSFLVIHCFQTHTLLPPSGSVVRLLLLHNWRLQHNRSYPRFHQHSPQATIHSRLLSGIFHCFSSFAPLWAHLQWWQPQPWAVETCFPRSRRRRGILPRWCRICMRAMRRVPRVLA